VPRSGRAVRQKRPTAEGLCILASLVCQSLGRWQIFGASWAIMEQQTQGGYLLTQYTTLSPVPHPRCFETRPSTTNALKNGERKTLHSLSPLPCPCRPCPSPSPRRCGAFPQPVRGLFPQAPFQGRRFSDWLHEPPAGKRDCRHKCDWLEPGRISTGSCSGSAPSLAFAWALLTFRPLLYLVHL
jgi:hypothetical protein